jgi:predicted metal-dependent hydrolase
MQTFLPFDTPPVNKEFAANHPSQVPDPRLVFTRHPKARRYILRVENDGCVRVTVPRRGSRKEALAFAERERAWIDKQRSRIDDARRRRALDRPPGNPPGTSTVDPETTEDEAALRARACRELPPRLFQLAVQHGVSVSRVSIRNQRWRWGSCSRRGHICLNWRLVTMPQDVRDYVLIHELMHLKRMDHSPKFWKLVAAACPGYRDARRWLRRASSSV